MILRKKKETDGTNQSVEEIKEMDSDVQLDKKNQQTNDKAADKHTKKKKGGKKKWIIIAIAIVLIVAIGTSNDNGSDASTDTTKAAIEQTTDGDQTVDESGSDDEQSEPSFSQDEAMRALVVACSNAAWSSDVYAEDGNTIDPDKLHSYEEYQSGSYLYGSKYDDCYAVDSSTWHIDGLYLESYKNGLITNYSFEVSGDVSFDGENYLVSNVTMEYTKYATDSEGNIDMLGESTKGTWSSLYDFSETPFEVSPSLIEDQE